MDLPSGDQVGMTSCSPEGINFSGAPPAAETRFNLEPSVYTSNFPSGDQRILPPPEFVSCMRWLPSILLFQRYPVGNSEYAIHCRSGDMANSLADKPPRYGSILPVRGSSACIAP